MKTITVVVLVSIFVFNICGFSAMGIDKRRARKGMWRIPERVLWMWAMPFSATGAYIGMRTFHHKTRHNSFAYGMPMLAVVQLALLAFVAIKFHSQL